jgi:hypothetical protein
MRIATAPVLAALGLLAALTFTGCIRREGRNSDCIWPPEQNARTLDPNRSADASHLREDVEFAEDLAIRYMDAQRHPRSTQPQPGRPPGEVMNTCRNSLLQQISTSHNVPPKEVVQFFGRRSLPIDLAIILPFLLLYGLLAALLAGWLYRRYPPEDGMTATVAMAILCSLAFAVGGMLLGEEWSTMAESIRIGTGHLSYRVDRLPWANHRIGFFVLCVALFWLAAAVRFRVQSRIVRSPTSHRII